MDHENIYYQVIEPELSSEELARVDAWLDEANKDDTDAFFEAVESYGPRQACEHCGIDLSDWQERATERQDAELCVLIHGSVRSGFRVYGPFNTWQDALAADHYKSGTVMKLWPPLHLPKG